MVRQRYRATMPELSGPKRLVGTPPTLVTMVKPPSDPTRQPVTVPVMVFSA
jgi:hypothetical protein